MTTTDPAGQDKGTLLAGTDATTQRGPGPRLALSVIDPREHFTREVAPLEHPELPEDELTIKNIGWTLGNDCPYRCTHCYSMSAREKGQDFTIGIIDRIVEQLASIGVETVNLGGNEPLFTNGPRPADTLLPASSTTSTSASTPPSPTSTTPTAARRSTNRRCAPSSSPRPTASTTA